MILAIKEYPGHTGGGYGGHVGDDTVQVDLLGNELKVGDTVDLYCKKENYGERVICKTAEYPDGFVMGLGGDTVFVEGKGTSGWFIIKNRNHFSIFGDVEIGDVKYILYSAT